MFSTLSTQKISSDGTFSECVRPNGKRLWSAVHATIFGRYADSANLQRRDFLTLPGNQSVRSVPSASLAASNLCAGGQLHIQLQFKGDGGINLALPFAHSRTAQFLGGAMAFCFSSRTGADLVLVRLQGLSPAQELLRTSTAIKISNGAVNAKTFSKLEFKFLAGLKASRSSEIRLYQHERSRPST